MILTDLERRLCKLLEDSMALNRQYERFALERQITHVQFAELRAMVTQITDALGLPPLPPMPEETVAPADAPVVDGPAVTLTTPEPPAPPLVAPPKTSPLRGRPNGHAYVSNRDERIIAALRNGPMRAVDVTRSVVGSQSVTKNEVKDFWRALDRLVRDGYVTKTNDNRYELTREAAVSIPPVIATPVEEREEVRA